MKKILLSLTLPLIFALNCHSQDFHYGLMAGLNLSKIHSQVPTLVGLTPEEEALYVYDPIITYNVNAFAQLKFLKYFGISVEPGFIIKGGENEPEPGLDSKYKINYLQVPVLGEIHPLKWFYFSLGPEFGYALSAKTITGGTSSDVTDQLTSKTEISGVFGVNVIFYQKFGLSLKYSRAFTNVSDRVMTNINGITTGQVREYNQYLQMSVRWYLK
ncbi:MAG: porin family protein [bacterium]